MRYERHGGTGTRLHTIWRSMRARCYTTSATSFRWYGAKGISVCDEWRKSFAAFRDWAAGAGYADNLQLDRIDNDGNYEPGNCRWVTATQNVANRPNYCGRSNFKGVCQASNRDGKWRATGSAKEKHIHIGTFSSEEDAALAYDRWAIAAHGKFASLNFPDALISKLDNSTVTL